MTTQDFTRHFRAGSISAGQQDVYIDVKFTDGRLSVTGSVVNTGELRLGDNRTVSCGQCVDSLRAVDEPASGIDVRRLADVWDRWHLNDMQPGTPRQMAFLRQLPPEQRVYERVKAALMAAGLEPDVPDDVMADLQSLSAKTGMSVGDLADGMKIHGYRYGSLWLREEVPEDVLAFLRDLPDETPEDPEQVLQDLGFRLECSERRWVSKQADKGGWEHFAWDCKLFFRDRLFCDDPGKLLWEGPYFVGAAVTYPEPPLRSVLQSLLCNESCYQSSQDLEDFCEQFGYADSAAKLREGRKAYEACKKTAEALLSLPEDVIPKLMALAGE